MSLVGPSLWGGWGFLKGQGFVVKKAGPTLAMGDTGEPEGENTSQEASKLCPLSSTYRLPLFLLTLPHSRLLQYGN